VTPWRDLAPRTDEDATPRRGAHLARAAIPLGLAVVLWFAGRRPLAVVLLVTAVGLAVLVTLRPSAGERIARALAVVGKAVAAAVSWVLLTLVAVVVIIPVSAIARLARRDPLGADTPGPTRWATRRRPPLTRRTFGRDEPARPAVGRTGQLALTTMRAIGIVLLVLALNYGLGWCWDEYVGSHDAPVASVAPSGSTNLADTPAFRDDPWAEAWWAAFDDLRYDPVPFLLTRVSDVTGDQITSADGIRRSWEPEAADAPEVWLFGGGAAWGQGQRDLHTIASEVARLADAAGRPVRVVNFAQPGYTTWQSALLFEQQLAVRPPPDLAVFYDGADDVAVQLEHGSDAPTHYNVDGIGTALTGPDSASEVARDAWEEYRETSVLTRLAQGFTGLFSVQPAAAADDELLDRVVDLRRRSAAVISGVADHHGVETLVAWQAATGVPGDDGAYRAAAAQGDEVDLSGVLDDRADAVFADGVLTDEEGARLVAVALWPLVEAALPS
jgi:hypothetical protein